MTVVDRLAALAIAAGAIVLLAGIVHAAFAPREAAAVFARGVLLALEFFLAAGLLRLGSAMTFTALGMTAAIIVTRVVIRRGLQPLAA